MNCQEIWEQILNAIFGMVRKPVLVPAYSTLIRKMPNVRNEKWRGNWRYFKTAEKEWYWAEWIDIIYISPTEEDRKIMCSFEGAYKAEGAWRNGSLKLFSQVQELSIIVEFFWDRQMVSGAASWRIHDWNYCSYALQPRYLCPAHFTQMVQVSCSWNKGGVTNERGKVVSEMKGVLYKWWEKIHQRKMKSTGKKWNCSIE